MHADHMNKLKKSKFSSMDSDMVPNELYKSTSDDKREYQDSKNATENSYYSDIPVISTSRPQSGMYDTLATPTPSHNMVKQSDNPLYSSTQELRLSNTYDTVPSKVRSQSQNDVRIPEPTVFGTSALYTIPTSDEKPTNTSSNRLSYGLEFEMSSHEVLLRHQRSLSHGVDSATYTEI